jgi:hypothetical protein
MMRLSGSVKLRWAFGAWGRGAGLRFQRRLGGADLRQALLLVRHPRRQFVAPPLGPVLAILAGVGGLSLGQPRRHLGGQRRFDVLHPPIAHRFVLGGVGPDLRPIQGDMAQLHQARALTQAQHLLKQRAQGREMAPPKRRDRAEVRPLQRRHGHEVHALFAGPGDTPRGVDPLAVGVQQQGRHHHGVIRRIAALLLVGLNDRGQVQFLRQRVPDEVRQVARRDEVQHRGRQQHLLLNVPLAEGLGHNAFKQSRPRGVHAFSIAAAITGTDS